MPYSIDFPTASGDQIAQAIGERLEQIRLARNLTQEWLAENAGVSVRTIGNLEKGKGISFDTFVRILIALGIQHNLEALLPDPAVRPIERVDRRGTERKRASSKVKPARTIWTWGDGEDDDE